MFYILYDENGQFYGFQDSEEYTQQIINDNTSLDYHEVSDEMHYFLINSQEKFTVNVKLISDDVECLDEEKYFLFAVPKRLRAFRNCFFTGRVITERALLCSKLIMPPVSAAGSGADAAALPADSRDAPVRSASS